MNANPALNDFPIVCVGGSTGLDYNQFSARAGGIDFYGDILFTSESELQSHPERVRAFLAASLQGWQYAMAHIDLVLLVELCLSGGAV